MNLPASGDRRKETIIVITGIVGLLLTYLIYRRSAHATATSGNGAPASGGVVNSPNSDGTQQLLTGLLAGQQTLSGQLGQIVTNTTPGTSTGHATPSGTQRTTALFHFSDLHGQAPTLKDIAQMVYGVATPGNMNALQKANPQFQYAGGKSGSGNRITNINRNSGINAPLATVQHVPLTEVHAS